MVESPFVRIARRTVHGAVEAPAWDSEGEDEVEILLQLLTMRLQWHLGDQGIIPSQPFFLHKQSSPCALTINSAYLSTTDCAISDAISTAISLPSTSLRLILTTSSLPHSAHLTRSLPWHVHPRLAHSTSLTRSGFGVQSVSSWKVASLLTSWSRSPGQYFGGPSLFDATDGAGLPAGVHFLSVIFEIVVPPTALNGDCPGLSLRNALPYLEGVLGPRTRGFFARNSLSFPIVVVAIEAAGGEESIEFGDVGASRPCRLLLVSLVERDPACCCCCCWSEAETGRLPIPWRRLLNLRFTVVFMVAGGKGVCVSRATTGTFCRQIVPPQMAIFLFACRSKLGAKPPPKALPDFGEKRNPMSLSR